MYEITAAIRREAMVARAQLDATKGAAAAAGEKTSAEMLNLIERKEYHRGRVDMAAFILGMIAREMRQDAAEDAWKRRSETAQCSKP